MAIDHNGNIEEKINPLGDTIATIELSPGQVHTLIMEWYKGKGYNVIGVSTEVGKETYGHGMQEKDEVVFKGAKVKIKLK
jgi:archaellum component FlaG (FlaF/FlaG flagellin family)